MKSVKMISGNPGLFRTGMILTIIGSMLVGHGLVQGLELSEALVLHRYLLFLFACVIAFITPWTLFPQQSIWIAQALNPGTTAIQKVMFKRFGTVWVGTMILISVISLQPAFTSSNIRLVFAWLDAVIIVHAILLLAMVKFVPMGVISQQWQEGSRGRALMDYIKETSSGGIGVPAGSMPTYGATLQVAVIGMMTVIAGAWIQNSLGWATSAAPALVLLFYALWRWRILFSTLDVHFYHSHGFYHELFRNPGGRSDAGREPIPFNSLYWVPGPIKPPLWLILRQMDRKLPLGRLIIVGFVLYWILIYSGVLTPQLVVIIPLLLMLVKNLSVVKMESVPYLSPMYRSLLGSEFKWFWIRSFGALRWSAPLHLFTGITVWFVGSLSAGDWQLWIYSDILMIFTIGISVSVWKWVSQRKQYA